MKILQFMKTLVTDEMLQKFKTDNQHYYRGGIDIPLSIDDVEQLIKSSKDKYVAFVKITFPISWEVVDYDNAYDHDHDHGAWTERYVIKVADKFYSMNFEYYGQGDFYGDETQYNEVIEVRPREITKIVYDKV